MVDAVAIQQGRKVIALLSPMKLREPDGAEAVIGVTESKDVEKARMAGSEKEIDEEEVGHPEAASSREGPRGVAGSAIPDAGAPAAPGLRREDARDRTAPCTRRAD